MTAIIDLRISLWLSEALLSEIREMLNRENVRAKFRAITPRAAQSFTMELSARGLVFDSVPTIFTWPQHPDDDPLFQFGDLLAGKVSSDLGNPDFEVGYRYVA